MKKIGKFIVFEGIDGSGKTTIIRELGGYLGGRKDILNKYPEIIYTLEPGGSNVESSQAIRSILLGKDLRLNNTTQALLFFASRSEHMDKLISPALNRGALVICDRFYLSTLVFQGKNDPVNLEWIRRTQEFITPITPDITFFVKIGEDEFRRRYELKCSGLGNNSLDDFAVKHYWELLGWYHSHMKNSGDRMGKIIELDGEGPLNLLVEKIAEVLLGL